MKSQLEKRIRSGFDYLYEICKSCFRTNTTVYIEFINMVLSSRGQQPLTPAQQRAMLDYKPATVFRVRFDYIKSTDFQMVEKENYREYYSKFKKQL